ncbi:ABC transporter permease [Sphingobacterium sp. Mn56C]|uniref:ABC transporter permease n=1 Tax=Sphingobacterium sp. Mn56C TaxID=3395261 RepID=UPI003BC49108
MNFPLFLARRVIFKGQRTFSKLIVRVTIGALALAIFAIVLSVAILRGFKGEITAKQRGFFSDIIVTRADVNQTENSPIALSEAHIQEILKIPNVESVSPFATKVGIMNVEGEVEGVLLKGIEHQYDQHYLSRTLVQGDTLHFGSDNADNQLLVSHFLAERLNLTVGESFIMSFVQDNRSRKRKFVVQGIFRTNAEELDRNYVIGSLQLIRRLNNLDDKDAGAYEIRVKNFDNLAETTRAVNEILPQNVHATNIVDQLPDIFNWLKMLDMNDDIIFGLMVIVAVINMISSLLITILERTSMIGMLKALGMLNRDLRKVFLYNSLYLIGYGLLLGNIVTFILYFLQAKTHFFKLDPAIYYIEYVPVSIDMTTVLLLNLSVVVISLLTLFIPSMLITRISPIKTIQFK